MTRHVPGRRRGFTLMEMLVVMVGLFACMAFGTALILTALRAGQAGEAGSARVARRADLATQFRADVARAEAAPDQLGDTTAGPTCLILRTPGGSVVYRWHADTLERVERAGDQEVSRRPVPVGPAGTAVEFVRPKDKTGVVALRLTAPAPPKPAPPRRAEVVAALGGDLR